MKHDKKTNDRLEQLAGGFLQQSLGLSVIERNRSRWTCTNKDGKPVMVAVRTSISRWFGYGKGFGDASMIVFVAIQRENPNTADICLFNAPATVVARYQAAKRQTLSRTWLGLDPVREGQPRSKRPEF